MKPKVEFVRRVYFPCSISEHRHKTAEVAQECIDKHFGPRRPHNRWDEAASRVLLNEIRAGVTDDYLVEKYRVKGVNELRKRAEEFEQQQIDAINFYLEEIVRYSPDVLVKVAGIEIAEVF